MTEQQLSARPGFDGASENEADRDFESTPGQERLRKIKEEHPKAYERWTVEEETRLLKLRSDGLSVEAISEILQRQPGGIQSRLQKLREDADPSPGVEATGREEEQAEPLDTQAGEVLFLPLAVSAMRGDAVCVAGVNVISRKWVRLVRRGKYALFSEDSSPFLPRQLMRVKLGGRQPRPQALDPMGLHVEDRLLEGNPVAISDVSADDRTDLLQAMLDRDLERALLEKRSLFLIEPISFRVHLRQEQSPKIAFSTVFTSTDDLRGSSALEQNKIGVSSIGCPCTCLTWSGSRPLLDHVRSEKDVGRTWPGARTFFALSLTGWPTDLPTERQKHYLLVAGIHILGRDQVWL